MYKDNEDNYLVMKQFNGVTGDYSNGTTPGMTSMAWNQVGTGCNIYYSSGFVGIGTNNPRSRFQNAPKYMILAQIVIDLGIYI